MIRQIKIHLISLTLGTSAFGQQHFNVNEDFPCNTCATYSEDLSKFSTQEYSVIKGAFGRILQSGITFNYPQGGCQDRAEIMSLILTRESGIQHAKIWLFAPVKLDSNDQRALKIPDNNHVTLSDTIYWDFHVAPCVIVGQSRDTLVIDPSMDSVGPIPVQRWFSKIGNNQVSKYTILSPQWYRFNTMDNGFSRVLNGYFYNYFSYTIRSDLGLEKGLALNDMAIYIIKKYIHSQGSVTDSLDIKKLNNLRVIFGDVWILDKLFCQLSSGITDNTTLRHAILQFPDVMDDAYQFYNKRLYYWTKKTESIFSQSDRK